MSGQRWHRSSPGLRLPPVTLPPGMNQGPGTDPHRMCLCGSAASQPPGQKGRGWGKGQRQPIRDRVSQGSCQAGRPAGHSQAATAVHCGYSPNPGAPLFPAGTRGPSASSAAQRLPCPHPSPAHLSSEQPQHPGRADAGWGLTALGSPRLSLPVRPSRPSTCRVSLTRKAHLPPALPSSRAVATVTPVTGSSWFPVSTQPRLQFQAGGAQSAR